MDKPYIVLIPGGWHKADVYELLVEQLEHEHYQVTTVDLPSVGAEPPVTSLEPDIAEIRRNIIPVLDQGQDVVVVMHSYSGVAGSSALYGLSRSDREKESKPGAVIALVYLTAWMTQLNESLVSSGAVSGGKRGPGIVHIEGNYVRHLDPVFAFYNDLPEDQAKGYAARLTHHSFPTIAAPLTYPAYRYIPATYLLCTRDNAIPYEQQLELVVNAGCPIQTVTCTAGHSPFLSQPELTARVIRRAAGEVIEV